MNKYVTRILLIMRITAFFILLAFLHLSATSLSQTVTLSVKDQPLFEVLQAIKKQTGYVAFSNEELFKLAKPVSIHLKNTSIEKSLQEIFKGQPLTFELERNSIVIREKEKSILGRAIDAFAGSLVSRGSMETEQQTPITGRIVDSAGAGIRGVTIRVVDVKRGTFTDAEGRFSLSVSEGNVISVSAVGYLGLKFRIGADSKAVFLSSEQIVEGVNKRYQDMPQERTGSFVQNADYGLLITLAPKISSLDDVEVSVNTGYQSNVQHKMTGSFSVVDRENLDKQITVNIIDRLASAANAVLIDQGTSQDAGQMMIRGLSTIKGPRSPLIILDNFPYDNDISNINPNIIDNITILKDASASSIWGARAANGVVIITTKTAKFNQPFAIDFNTSLTLSNKPNLSYIRQMSSSDFIDVEKELFSHGYYDSDINSPLHPVLSPVVNLLNKAEKGIITAEQAQQQINSLRHNDIRDEYRKYMYKPVENRQYALNISSGSPSLSWISELGYDDNFGNLGEKYQRLNVRLQNTWKPANRITLTTGTLFNQNKTRSGRSGYGSITVSSNGLPYLKLADEAGNPLSVPKQYDQDYKISLGNGKLLDWNYYPLTDWQYSTSKGNNTEIILTSSLNYKIMKGLEAEFKYQYQHQAGISQNLSSEQSYFARNYINQFTSIKEDGSLIYNVPKGAIMSRSESFMKVSNFRTQLNFDRTWNQHNITAIIGGETRSSNTQYTSNIYYGYNTNNLSFGSVDYNQGYSFITGSYGYIDNGNSVGEYNTNFISTYANASYTFASRYTISGSGRRDASNLFGLSTNDQWNPFWSAGAAWNISNESFFNVKWLSFLKLRSSLGYNGNIDPSMVAVTTISYLSSASPFTGEPMAMFSNYYNPKLRWESMKILNIAVDFEALNNRISGYVEFFSKNGDNLFGATPIDYTTGISELTWNVAGIQGKGLDVQLKTININRAFGWKTLINFSTYHDKVTKYYLNNTSGQQFLLANVPISGIEGLPVYSMFAYRWGGLDHETGEPIGYLNGELSKDYDKITGAGTDIEDLQYYGSAVPTVYGNFTNSFSFRQLSLDIGITYKLGYWFRRSSINYTSLFTDWNGHSDYAMRWQKPGDDVHTNVPSNLYQTNSNRDAFYAGSSVLVEKGDHIRLQYINLTYKFNEKIRRNTPFSSLELYANANNIGILWQSSKSGIDPDYNMGRYTLAPNISYTIGLKANF